MATGKAAGAVFLTFAAPRLHHPGASGVQWCTPEAVGFDMTPHRCDILAIDPGQRSGAAIFRRGQLSHCAEIDIGSHDVESWVQAALLPALDDGITLVMVGETWGTGGPMGMSQWQGLGAAWKRWEWALGEEWAKQRAMGRSQPAPKAIRVHVATWRSKVFGGRMGANMAKAMAVQVARQRLGAQILDDQHNAAEAACIGFWAMYAPEVLDLIPKRFR